MRLKTLSSILIFVAGNAVAPVLHAAPLPFDIYGTGDTFELAAPPEATYGAAGALNVSGSQALNNQGQMRGITDTWIKYDPAPAIAQFNQTFGPGHWIIVSATLNLHEDPAPNNSIYGIGAGQFSVTWMANDNWSEGNGKPNSPGAAAGNRIGYTYGHSILNPGVDELLGDTFQNDLTFDYHAYSLALTPGFKADLAAGNPVSLFLTAMTPTTGFTFNSRTHSNLHWITVVADVDPSLACRGDLSGDRIVRGDDIDGYIEDFLNPGGLTPAEFDVIDMNDSETLDNSDISCFVSALLATHDCNATGPYVCP